MTYDEVAENLIAADPAVEASKMFGMPVLKTRGKVICGEYHGDMVFKLGEPDHAKAMALPGATVFDPSGMNRAMKAWVQVPLSQAEYWLELAEAAKCYVVELQSKA